MNKEILLGMAVSGLLIVFLRKFPAKLFQKICKRRGRSEKSSNKPLSKFDSSNPEEVRVEQDFQKACKAVESNNSLSTDQSLGFYGLFKQSIFGDNISDKPFGNIVASKKWEAWNSRKGLSSLEAKKEYVRLVEAINPNFRDVQKKERKEGEDSDDELFMTDAELQELKSFDKEGFKMVFSRPVMGREDANAEQKDEQEDIAKFLALIDEENIEALEKLIKAGFDLNKDTASGMKPIHYAIENEKESVVELLIKHYKDLNVQDETGMTPLHYAVAHENKEIIELLLKKNVDIHKTDEDGSSAIDMATSSIKKFIESCLGVKLE